MKKIIIVLYLFCPATYVNAQNSFYDSLKNLLASAKDDTTKFDLLGTLVEEYTFSMPDSALTYAQKEMSLAGKMHKARKRNIQALKFFCHSNRVNCLLS